MAEEDNKKALEILKREFKIQLIEQNRIKENEIKRLKQLTNSEDKKKNALNDLRNQIQIKLIFNNELNKLKDEIKNQFNFRIILKK